MPLYALPLQVVRARVLAVDAQLSPVAGVAPVVELYDPNGFILERWTSALDELGVGTYQFATSADGSLGTYRLKATAQVRED